MERLSDPKTIKAITENTAAIHALINQGSILKSFVYKNIGDEDDGEFYYEDDADNYESNQTFANEKLYNRAMEAFIIITTFSIISIILFTLYVGWAWLNFNMIHGYPSLHVPGSPSAFVSERDTFQRYTMYALIINFFPPVFLMLAAAFPITIASRTAHQIFTLLALVINGFVGIMLFILLWFYCNGGNANMSVLANDVYWCCVHYPLNFLKCGFNVACSAGAKTMQKELTAPIEYILGIMVAWMGVFFAYLHWDFAGKFQSWGLWRLSK